MIKKLQILTWPGIWQRALDEAVSKPFEKEKGVSIKYYIHPNLDLPLELINSFKEKNSFIDVVFCNDTEALNAAKNNYCLALNDSLIPNLKQTIKPAKLIEDNKCFAISMYYVIYCLVYRKNLFNDKPISWNILLEERFSKKIALYPGGKGFFPIAQIMGGGKLNMIPQNMSYCWNFIKKIKHQIKSSCFTLPLIEFFKKKEIDLAFRTLSDATFLLQSNSELGIAFPKEGVSNGSDVFWIPKHLPKENIDIAKEFINFSLREDIQKNWSKKLASIPVHCNLQNIDNIKKLYIPRKTEMENDHNWQKEFDQIIQ